MTRRRGLLGAFGFLFAGGLLLACGASSPSTTLANLPVLGPQASCAERADARPVCLRAVESRCASQRGDCEAICLPRLGPGNSEKQPGLRGDLQEERCREGCRQSEHACQQALLPQCPSLCDANEAAHGPPVDPPTAEREITAALDDLHDAAAHSDEARYFAHFSPLAIFLGTDATERWDLTAFRAYAHPHFSAGKGWSFHVQRRSVTLDEGGSAAWFDEDLLGDKLGPARGSGVVLRVHGQWLIGQYNLAFTIPNERVPELRALLESPPKQDLHARHDEAYKLATAALAQGHPERAIELLAPLVAEAKTRPADDLEFWIDNQLTWVRWSTGDIEGALGEVEHAKTALDHATLPADKTRALRLHERWDRAYLLLERAKREPVATRAKAMAEADRARAEYDELAKAAADHDGMAVLAAFFASSRGDKKAAGLEAKKVDVTKDDDLQDLYILERALDGAGDHDAAARARARICAGHDYLLKPVFVHALEADGQKCAP